MVHVVCYRCVLHGGDEADGADPCGGDISGGRHRGPNCICFISEVDGKPSGTAGRQPCQSGHSQCGVEQLPGDGRRWKVKVRRNNRRRKRTDVCALLRWREGGVMRSLVVVGGGAGNACG